jgi:hypothetical protein
MTSFSRRLKPALALAAVAAGMCLALLAGAPQAAHATESPYCGGWVGGQQTCYGESRTFNAVYGTGAQHAVCVGSAQGGNVTCTSGPGEGTYDALGEWVFAAPWIQNRGLTENLVHGIAFTP